MDKDKKWDRKEVVTVDPGSLLSGGVDVYFYGKGKDSEGIRKRICKYTKRDIFFSS